MFSRTGLVAQINRRIFAALVIATASGVLVGTWTRQLANDRIAELTLAQEIKHVNSTISQIERNWGREAYAARIRLEQSGVLSDPHARQVRARNYFTSVIGSDAFPIIRVLDEAGDELVSYTYAGEKAPDLALPADVESAWVWLPDERTLIRVFQQPVWTGSSNGTLQLSLAADNSLLSQFEDRAATVSLVWDGKPIAMSRHESMMKGDGIDRRNHFSLIVRWGSLPNAPQLDVVVDPIDAFKPSDLAVPLLLSGVVFALALWLSLGRWTLTTLSRLSWLSEALARFATERSLEHQTHERIVSATGTTHDEIQGLALSAERMMTAIASAESAAQEATDALAASERRFRLLLESTEAVIWEFNPVTDQFTYVSPRAQELLGYSIEEWMAPGFWRRILVPENAGASAPRATDRRVEAGVRGQEFGVHHRNGHIVWILEISSPVWADDETVTAIHGISLDITLRKNLEQQLLLNDLVVRNTSEGVLVTDGQNRILSVNPAFEAITGYSQAEVLGKNPSMLSSGMQGSDFYQTMWSELKLHGQWKGEIWNRKKSGEPYAQRVSIVSIRNKSPDEPNHIALFSDITHEKQQEEMLAHQANHDPLTELPNRRLLTDRTESALARARRDGTRVGLLVLDLDGFKHINDTLGHQTGDRVLIEVAARLSKHLRATDTLARLGGDEFVILIEGLDNQAYLEAIAGKILKQIKESLQIEKAELFVTTSIGIAVFPEDGSNPGQLMANADAALYRAKSEGRNAFRFFTREMHDLALKRLEIETDLRRGMRDKEFVLYYQPIIDLRTGDIVKAEALIRWNHPSRHVVSPSLFIPVAEETGLILELGEWLIDEAFRQIKSWENDMPDGFRVALNLSAQQFLSADPSRLLSEHLAKHALSADKLSLEITESLLIDRTSSTIQQLTRLRRSGFEIALDDFGTGYSSLSYLQLMPIDVLKIDRSFVMGIEKSAKSSALVKSIVGLGESFGLSVIAEGVETDEQCRAVTDLGCALGQGYRFGRPCPAEEFKVRYLDPATAPR